MLTNQRHVEVDAYVQPKALRTKRGTMATALKSLRKPMRRVKPRHYNQRKLMQRDQLHVMVLKRAKVM